MKFIREKGFLIIIPLIYFVIIFYPNLGNYAFIPDYLLLSNLKSVQDFFGLIIGVIASIFGILMAVVILAVEFFKEKLNKDNYLNPFDNYLIKNFIFLSVNIICLSFFSYLFIDRFNSSNYLTVGYFIGLLFVSYLYSVFPVLKSITNSSSQIKKVLEIAENLDLKDFTGVSKYRYESKNMDSDLRKLKKEIDVYILENKIHSYEVINDKILRKATELVGDGLDRKNCDIIFGALTWLWLENCKTAIRANDSQYFEAVWKSIDSIYLNAADKKIELLHLQEIEMFIYFDFKNLYKYFKNSISLGFALNVIENSFNNNVLKNCPKQEEVWELMNLYEKTNNLNVNFSASSSWDHIIRIIDFVGDIQDVAIDLGDRELFEECNQRINSMCSHIIFEFNNLGKYQKGFLLWHSITNNYYRSSLALKQGLFNNTLHCYHVHKYLILRIIESNVLREEDVRVIIKSLGNDIFNALKDKKLYINYDLGTFHDFCMIGLHSIKKYNESALNKNVVDFYINYFIKVKSYIEQEGIESYSDEYKTIKRVISHFINVAKDYEEFNLVKEPLKSWEIIQNDFKELSKDSNFNIDWKI